MIKMKNWFCPKKKLKTFFTEKQKPVLKVNSTVVPDSFNSKVNWDRHLYDNITVYKDK